jgi:hypothetical protein
VITWKSSFNRLNEEYGIAKKKKQALDNLFTKGKISQTTHDSFNTEIAAAIVEIEKQQTDLVQKMQLKTQELHSQIQTLEILLANYEIQYVAGEIDDNTYQLEINLLSNGLDAARTELGTVQDAVNQLCASSTPTITIPAAPAPVEITPEITLAAPEPIIQEIIVSPFIEEKLVFEQPIAEAAIEQPIAEAAIEQPIAEAAIEQPIAEAAIEQPIAEAAVVEAPIATELVVEEAVVQEVTIPELVAIEDVAVAEVAKELAVEEPALEEEKVPLDQFDVATSDVVQKDLTQIVEEIFPENPCEAPIAAHEEAAVEVPQEVCAETQHQPVHCAKETLHEAYSDSENKE